MATNLVSRVIPLESPWFERLEPFILVSRGRSRVLEREMG